MEYKLATLFDTHKTFALFSLFIQIPLLFASKLCKVGHCNALDIDSTNVFDKILAPFLFRCNLDPFRCLTVIFLSWFIQISFFLYVTPLKLYLPLLLSCGVDRFSVILETNTSRVSDFKEVATPIIDSVICSGCLFDAKSFVPT